MKDEEKIMIDNKSLPLPVDISGTILPGTLNSVNCKLGIL
jgi:hypothetical protein